MSDADAKRDPQSVDQNRDRPDKLEDLLVRGELPGVRADRHRRLGAAADQPHRIKVRKPMTGYGFPGDGS